MKLDNFNMTSNIREDINIINRAFLRIQEIEIKRKSKKDNI